jgi:DNA replication protein DnaC
MSVNIVEMIKLKMMMGNNSNSESLYGMLMMVLFFIIEQNYLKIWNYVEKKYIKVISDKLNPVSNDKYNIFLEKDFGEKKNSDIDDVYLEAVLHDISEKYNIKSVFYMKNLYVINFFEQFEISTNIYGKLHKLEFDSNNKPSVISLQISSETLVISDLRKYIDECYSIYKRKIQNNLGNDLYFFNQMSIIKKSDRNLINTYPSFLIFEYNKFFTNRTFSNVFGESIKLLQKRVNFFKNNKKWYDEKGIPYTFGALLYGVPGTGKTSVIKAIANECNRHIVNINLSQIKTNTQLKDLFYSKNIHCIEDLRNISYNIDINERLYVIEDIDCMSDIVLDRTLETEIPIPMSTILEETETDCETCKHKHCDDHCFKKTRVFCNFCKEINKETNDCSTCNSNEKHCKLYRHCEYGVYSPLRVCNFCEKYPKANDNANDNDNGNGSNLKEDKSKDQEQEGQDQEENSDKITLSSLLNILDGTLELPGRMIVITSNFPEKLDKALIRPGRIDMIIELGKATCETIKEMYNSFYSSILDQDSFDQLPDKRWTPAEINCILFNNFDDPINAIKTIINEKPLKYFKI